jgi:hypothetical protein
VSAALTLLLLAALAASWLDAVHILTATPPRIVPPPRNRGANPRFQEREETHFLLRRGMLVVQDASVGTTLGFDHPDADKNSRVMARGVIDNSGVSPWTTIRLTSRQRRDGLRLVVPLWMPAAASGLVSAFLWRRYRGTARPGHCACGYALEGLTPGSPCPECGR